VPKLVEKTRSTRLIIVGLLLMTTGGTAYEILSFIGVNASVPALFLVFGVLSFVVGLSEYLDESGKSPGRRRRASRM